MQDKVHFLQQKAVDLPGGRVRVAGCTLWAHIPAEKQDTIHNGMCDYAMIQGGCAAQGPDRSWQGLALGSREAERRDGDSTGLGS